MDFEWVAIALGDVAWITLAFALGFGVWIVGAMLAYAAHHLLLLDRTGAPLVVTSGNAEGAGIVYQDADAAARLAPLPH